VHFAALKIQLLPSLETHVQGYVASCVHIFCILAAWKCDFCRVVKPMLQGYRSFVWTLFLFMATWKCDSFNTMTKFKGHAKRPISRPGSKVKGQGQTRTTHRVSSLRAFWRLENTFTAESWNSRSRVPGFVRTHFLHFGGVKMRFLPSHETHATRVRSVVWTHLLLYGDLKMWVLIHDHAKRPNSRPGSKVKVKHELNIARAHLVHFGALKIHLLPIL